MLAEQQVRKAGFATVTCTCLAETRDVLDHHTTFLCAILDYNLPDAHHGEVIDLCLAVGLKVVVLTASQTEKTRDEILSKPVIDYIPKDSSHCIDAVCRLVKRLADNQGHRVLVVDDSASIRKRISALLARQYLTVLEAENGEQALDVLEKTPDISLIITDYEMPKMDGLQLVYALRKKDTECSQAIIGLSGHNDSALTARFLKAGANDYLPKPFNQEEFFCRVHSCLNAIDTEWRLFLLANTDFLTQLWNRRYFFERGDQLANEARKHLAIIDIDYFKRINDDFGHHIGDDVLVEVAQMLADAFPEDTVARLGGEEFCVLSLRDLTVFQQSLDSYRQSFAERPVRVSDQTLKVTVSIGVDSQAASLSRLLHTADQALYQAKASGRNQMVVHQG
ncbi:diguanylate cyclase [Salinivibrio sp. VYel9]|nr:diguanylate cyclase [Salinivibrio sp. VYel7]MPX90530.1 diguanylate cyclase [Salinivibrio sp. VYel1]MPX93940.1 diguanylate cyclase [Salinivibrio sp. VYel9]MPX96177.1 diguanylate cyclase [Salinivibrio sp. VYel6]MPY00405.1 diguanylate cyclase [Salinivibrio sp. VYel4]MPY03418.1 diguanylate cyclase [Salinivibrio sp. VYel5]MPY06398.1 diguanylate cyclase [Salinivibrio sp. VYel8]MPY14486.1 diguanylate cyclase [Salinivibrio sp. VGrn1]